MKLTLEISVKPVAGLPLMFLTAQKDGKTLDVKYDPDIRLSELFVSFEGMAEDKPIIPVEPRVPPASVSRETETPFHDEPTQEPVRAGDFNPDEIQREDLIQLSNVQKGLCDMSGNELDKRQVKQGGIYRVLKVHQQVIAMPNLENPEGEPKMTKIVNSYEVLDDKAATPERLVVFPQECVLYKKREKKFSIVKPVFSEFLKCQNCGEMNAFVLKENKFEGVCPKCQEKNSIERMIELCSNEKCLDAGKARSKVSLFLYGEKFTGVCGNCKSSMEVEPK